MVLDSLSPRQDTGTHVPPIPTVGISFWHRGLRWHSRLCFVMGTKASPLLQAVLISGHEDILDWRSTGEDSSWELSVTAVWLSSDNTVPAIQLQSKRGGSDPQICLETEFFLHAPMTATPALATVSCMQYPPPWSSCSLLAFASSVS